MTPLRDLTMSPSTSCLVQLSLCVLVFGSLTNCAILSTEDEGPQEADIIKKIEIVAPKIVIEDGKQKTYYLNGVRTSWDDLLIKYIWEGRKEFLNNTFEIFIMPEALLSPFFVIILY